MNHRKVGLRLHIVYCDTSFLNIISVSSLSLYCPLDYKKGFGGSFGIQKDRVDKSAHGWEHVENVDKHASQKGEKFNSLVKRERLDDVILEAIFTKLFYRLQDRIRRSVRGPGLPNAQNFREE